MTFYSGQNGRMLIDGVQAAKVVNWSFSVNQSPLSTTVLSDTDNTFINGLRTTTGSATLFYYDDSSGSTVVNSAKALIDNLIKPRSDGAAEPGRANEATNVTLSLQVVDGTTIKQMVVDALLTSATMSMGVGEVLSAQVAFQVNGAPTTVTL